MTGISRRVLHTLDDALTHALTLGGGGGGGPTGSGVRRWAPMIGRVLDTLGISRSWIPAGLHRMQVESGGNPRAINLWDSNAKAGHPSRGLFQTIPGTFAAYAGPYRSLGIYNPFANTYAAVRYALARYGVPFVGGTHGYARGAVEDHKAQIAKPPTYRVWAEPETGGEAYIPLAGGAKRPRAKAVLADVASRFGGQVVYHAAGGTYRPIGQQVSASGGPLIGQVTIQVPQSATARQVIDELSFELRRISGGGRYAHA
jgi:hypothetical protein